MGRISNLWVLLGLALFTVSIYDFHINADVIPSENECRPYIEKAIHELNKVDAPVDANSDSTESNEIVEEIVETKTIDELETGIEDNTTDEDGDSVEEQAGTVAEEAQSDENNSDENKTEENDSVEQATEEAIQEDGDSQQEADESVEDKTETEEQAAADEVATEKANKDSNEESDEKTEESATNSENDDSKEDSKEDSNEVEAEVKEEAQTEEKPEEVEGQTDDDSNETNENSIETETETPEGDAEDSVENDTAEAADDSKEDSKEDSEEVAEPSTTETATEADDDSQENATNEETDDSVEEASRVKRSLPDESDEVKSDESNETVEQEAEAQDSQESNETTEEVAVEIAEEQPEEDLTMEFEIPKNLRAREHVSQLLGLDAESSIKENALKKTGDVILKDLKRIYDSSVKPLESMYKYRDLSNRHFGDPEMFSKPLVLFMGPWSGGKSTILNYLTDNEYTPNSIRSGAEPSPAYFNIMMHGDEPEVLDGTQLAADWTFSGLQKFGQGLNDRLRGQKLPSKLLERVNIVEIPGILEVRKQVSRYFPFNDACQWFIDRADIIFLVYDPSKLDVGPETEAILDQLKGREYQTRILLNKADQVKPEELLRVQGALIWNISPLMSSAQPPIMYTLSLWSHPYESGAPIRLLQAQERAFLTDLREAIDKRIENKIASARRFAVRIRNHAKMVDCYLTTYYNQKTLFSNKKQVSNQIIEHPQTYNIYEGLSTLTNISRYDLPDPEVYLDFFRLNPLYEFKKLSESCTYFKGCPINKLDVAIAYDFPEMVGKYKKLLEQNLSTLKKEYDDNCNQTEPELPVKMINSR
ncbi:unnamed protein product [Diamesa serratosioi]